MYEGRPRISFSLKRIEPVARGIIPMTAAQRVVLPMPLRPITATPSAPIARLTPSRTCAWP